MSEHIESGFLVTHRLIVGTDTLTIEEYCSTFEEICKVRGEIKRVEVAKICLTDDVTDDMVRRKNHMATIKAHKARVAQIIKEIKVLEGELKRKVRVLENNA
jgi:hypothetical protein